MAAAYAALEDPGSGGVVIFVGRVRPDRRGDRSVGALEYESHRSVALQQLAAMERASIARPGVRRVLLWHRIGRLPVGTPSVIVAVASGHRALAFREAARLIAELKDRVPIWKSERWRSAHPRRPPPRPRPGPGAD
ncbi:MAG: molybdopterin synthase catalytic subunit [Thermoplasmata archaeon]